MGKETHWVSSDAQLAEIKAGLKPNAKFEIIRFKGLGEMDATDLARTTLDPKQRTLLKVDIDSVLDANSAFQELLGKDAEPRYNFIMERATEIDAEKLDV